MSPRLAAVLCLLASCMAVSTCSADSLSGNETQAPPPPQRVRASSVAEIAGIWDSRVYSERGFHHFRQDGTMVMAFQIEKLPVKGILGQPVDFWFEGDVFHVEDSCGHGRYAVTIESVGGVNRSLTFDVIEDPCTQRVADWKTGMRWVRAD